MAKITPKLIDEVFDDSVLDALPTNDKINKGLGNARQAEKIRGRKKRAGNFKTTKKGGVYDSILRDFIKKKAKDILRASQLPRLHKKNIHVKNNLKKVKKGKLMSPVLLVRGENKLIIADGYHRVCAIYYLSEDLEIPCRIV